MDKFGHHKLETAPCEYCGKILEPQNYLSSADHNLYWYYDHAAPWDCIKHLRSLIDDIGSRRIV